MTRHGSRSARRTRSGDAIRNRRAIVPNAVSSAVSASSSPLERSSDAARAATADSARPTSVAPSGDSGSPARRRRMSVGPRPARRPAATTEPADVPTMSRAWRASQPNSSSRALSTPTWKACPTTPPAPRTTAMFDRRSLVTHPSLRRRKPLASLNMSRHCVPRPRRPLLRSPATQAASGRSLAGARSLASENVHQNEPRLRSPATQAATLAALLAGARSLAQVPLALGRSHRRTCIQ